jgi:DNA-binding protein
VSFNVVIFRAFEDCLNMVVVASNNKISEAVDVIFIIKKYVISMSDKNIKIYIYNKNTQIRNIFMNE